MLSEIQRKRAFNMIVCTQCLGLLPVFISTNGFYLSYFSHLGISSSRIAFILAIPSLVGMSLLIPFAHFSDRKGKMLYAMIGQFLIVLGLSMLALASLWADDPQSAFWVVTIGICIFGAGSSLQLSNWFALLNPIVPKEIRGQFFGRLRVTFQIVGIIFTFVITWILKQGATTAVYCGIMLFVVCAMAVRTFFYLRIPELEDKGHHPSKQKSIIQSIRELLRNSDYCLFNIYIFFLALFTMSVPLLLGLLEHDVLLFSPSQITLMGMILIIGGILGCWVGGKLTDRFGARRVFIWGKTLGIISLVLIVGRFWFPWSDLIYLGLITLLFCFSTGAHGVAITSEVLRHIPRENKSMSTALTMMLSCAGGAISGLVVSQVLGSSLLNLKWSFLGHALSIYDLMLLLSATCILLLLFYFMIMPSTIRPLKKQ